MSNYVNSYRVIIRMENDEVIEWEGYADDSDHAEGLALDYAKARTNEQAYEIMEVDEFDQFEVLTEVEATELYDDMLDESHEPMQIGYLSFSASEVLSECDPVAYRCGFSEFCDSLLDSHQLVEGFY